VINSRDDNYVPNRIVVMGGSTGNLRKLNDVTIDQLVFFSSALSLLRSIRVDYI